MDGLHVGQIPILMKTHIEAQERAKELAMNHMSAAAISQVLEKEGLGGFLNQFELEKIVAEAGWIRGMLPEKPKTTFPRIIGLIAVIMGIAAILLEGPGPSVRRYSPSGYGFLAVILGLVLIFKPSSAKTDV